MHVWNVLHVARWKYRMQKLHKKSQSVHHRTTSSGCIFATDNWKKTCLTAYLLHMSSQCGDLCLRSVPEFGAPQQISTGFVSWLLDCSDIAHHKPTKLCTMLGCFLGRYTIYTFSGDVCATTEFTLCPSLVVLLYWQRYCAALQQWASAKLCYVVQGMELLNFCRGRHLYLAGRPSLSASAHMVVIIMFNCIGFITCNILLLRMHIEACYMCSAANKW